MRFDMALITTTASKNQYPSSLLPLFKHYQQGRRFTDPEACYRPVVHIDLKIDPAGNYVI
ncbi:hypothetical protein I7I53_03428 [Histoplasma capsulatum var. duboisii H88]|uniref:Uncharacterized protein n=1 Tax=Ajellomyces capsulatus (strain H88) TaxID=544711 RepID=A0A8A1LQW7_AJEC8|nr:hypothetical protein I7I53_03428 [Histoplasma capsulatum var. duboisii H88]